MLEWFKGLFKKDIGGLEINLFDGWHFMYLILIFGSAILTAFLLKNKSERAKKITVNTFLISALVLYALDFMLMPFSIGHISIDKLPFHICTSVSIITGFAMFNKHFNWLKTPATVLSIVAPLMYLTYPGSALGNISPFSYTVIQTMLYHGCLFIFGFLALTTGEVKLNIKQIWKELVVIVGIALWASIGNALYQGIPSGSHYDWFFLTGSTFPFIPKWLMPFVVVVCVYGMVAIIYGLYYLVNYIITKIESKRLATANVLENTTKVENVSDEEVKAEEIVEEVKTENKTAVETENNEEK